MNWRDDPMIHGCGGCIVFLFMLAVVVTTVTYLTPQ